MPPLLNQPAADGPFTLTAGADYPLTAGAVSYSYIWNAVTRLGGDMVLV